jgi:hypothetical protein
MAELATDSLVREIGASTECFRPYRGISDDAKVVQEHIDKSVEILEHTLSDLKSIRGVD